MHEVLHSRGFQKTVYSTADLLPGVSCLAQLCAIVTRLLIKQSSIEIDGRASSWCFYLGHMYKKKINLSSMSCVLLDSSSLAQETCFGDQQVEVPLRHIHSNFEGKLFSDMLCS